MTKSAKDGKFWRSAAGNPVPRSGAEVQTGIAPTAGSITKAGDGSLPHTLLCPFQVTFCFVSSLDAVGEIGTCVLDPPFGKRLEFQEFSLLIVELAGTAQERSQIEEIEFATNSMTIAASSEQNATRDPIF